MAKIDTLTCDSCGVPVWDVYEPATVMIPGTVLCKAHGDRLEGLHFHLPSDAVVPEAFVYVGPE